RRHDSPVRFRLQASVSIRRARELVIREHHTMTDEDLVADIDTLANESVRRDLAAHADGHVLLNLNERAYLGVVADGAAVQIYERGLEYFDVGAKSNGLGNRHEISCGDNWRAGSMRPRVRQTKAWRADRSCGNPHFALTPPTART